MSSELEKVFALKGFMPKHEGLALMKWCKTYCESAPALEIGSFCGKSAHLLAFALKESHQKIFTLDHHLGSEEHQTGQEYFDPEIFDKTLDAINTLPIFMKNLAANNFGNKIIPLIGKSQTIAEAWQKKLGLLFIDGGHAYETALNDYISWNQKIIKGGVLVFHDIYEDANLGGLAPYRVMQKSIEDGYRVIDREDTIVCLQR